jgi:hypothetical protein
MNKVFKMEPSFAEEFEIGNDEFEIRVTDEGDKLEIWKIGYENGNCIGYVDLIAEFDLEQMK